MTSDLPLGTKGPLVGIFVGGQSSRMGRPKGLLAPPDGTAASLVERTLLQARAALGEVPCVLVGENSAYDHLSYPVVADALPRAGPLGGIVGLLQEGERRGHGSVLVLGCDFPYLSAQLIRRLSSEQPHARCLCPRLEGFYQPLAARYDVSVLPEFQEALVGGRLSMQPLLKGAPSGILELSLEEERSLLDWDTPEDVGR